MGIIVTRQRLLAALLLSWIAGATFLHQAANGFARNPLAVAEIGISLACLIVAMVLLDRGKLVQRLRRRQSMLVDSHQSAQLAEELANMGNVTCDVRTGRMHWSRGMHAIHQRAQGDTPAYSEWLGSMPVCGPLVQDVFTENRDAIAPYGMDYHVLLSDRRERIIRLRVKNQFDDDGKRVAWSGAAMDITDQSRREAALEAAHKCAIDLAAEAKTLSETDALTGLANRRRTIEKLAGCLVRAHDEDRPLAVIVFDLDRFKRINDRFGHQTGDDVLVRTAELARGQVRASDLVGRVGGEEFVWVLPDCDGEEASAAGERLRRSIATKYAEDRLPNFTASIGVATFERGDDVQSLLGRADRALYEAKADGRNRVRRAA